jgi:hypothetical protein
MGDEGAGTQPDQVVEPAPPEAATTQLPPPVTASVGPTPAESHFKTGLFILINIVSSILIGASFFFLRALVSEFAELNPGGGKRGFSDL